MFVPRIFREANQTTTSIVEVAPHYRFITPIINILRWMKLCTIT